MINGEKNESGKKQQALQMSDAVSLISIFGAMSLALSFVFEIGYFSVVGWDFLSILSSADYIHHAIFVLIGSFVVIALPQWPIMRFAQAFRKKIKEYRTAEDRTKSERAGQLVILGWIIFILFVVIFLFNFLFTPVILAIVVFSALTIVILLIFFAQETLGRQTVLSIGAVTLLLVLSFTDGHSAGTIAMHSNKENYNIVSTFYRSGKKIILVRFVDKGVLYILQDEKKIEFSPWNQIITITSNYDASRELRLIDFIRN